MRRFIQLFMAVCCLMSSVVAMAQTSCRVYGTVVDAMNETVPYATVGAYKNEKNVIRLVADINGVFELTLQQGEEYAIEITSVGFAPYRQSVTLSSEAQYDMGTIVLKSSTELEEVVVEAQRPIIKSDAEKITYDVAADPESDGKTLLDMFRKVPMITVDSEDNVQLNGSSDFKVLINGKESAMVKNNLKEVLRAMPAAAVQDIQVITNPSTRYDAEGVGGVINIITAQAGSAGSGNSQADLSGVTGSVTGYGDVLQGTFGGNVYLMMQHKRFTASLNYSGGKFSSNQYSRAEQFNYNNPDMYRTLINTMGDMNVDGQYHFLSFESSYELDSLNLFTLGLSGNWGRYGAAGKGLNQIFNQSGGLVVNYIDYITQGGLWGGASANLDYQHTFDRPMHTLTTSYRYEYNPAGASYSDSILFDDETLNAPLAGQMNDNDAYTQEHTVQVDYNNPINDVHSIEAGAKYIARINHSNDDYMMLVDKQWLSTGMAQQFDYTQQIAALYAGYGFTKSNWGFRLGGRYEMTFIDATSIQGNNKINYGKPYGNFVPYASINYNLSPMESLRLSYTQRINRPGIHYLSPYEQWTTPSSVQSGNPDLRPEVSHSISAAYSIFMGKFNLNFQWTSRISNNAISALTLVEPETSVSRTTYANIATRQSHGMSIFMSGTASPKFNYYVNLQPSYEVYSAPHLNRKSTHWGGSAFAGFNWTAWKDGTVSLNGGGGMPGGGLQREVEAPWYYYGLSISQRFLDDKLKVTLSANNIFNKYTVWRSRSYGEGFSAISEGGQRSQRLSVSVTYTFGKLNARVKKAHRGIVNDDIVGGSSEGMGGAQGGVSSGMQ